MLSRLASYQSLSDVDLMFSFKRGDKIAFDVIYKRYWKKLYNETFRKYKKNELLEEIVQDVFTDLWEKRKKKNIDNLYPYLLTSVRYQVFSNYKKGQSSPEFEETNENSELSYLQADTQLNLKELKGSIAIWMATQPAKRAEIFRLKYMEEYSNKEISSLLGISMKTIQNQQITSYNSLREHLSKMMLLVTVLP